MAMVDRRVPGEAARETTYVCPVQGCTQKEVSIHAPRCPLHRRTVMDPSDPYKERRQRIRERRGD